MPLNSFEFDAPKWHDFSRPSFIQKQKMLLQLLDASCSIVSSDSYAFEADFAEMYSESSSWFEVPHPEHEELVSGMADCNLDSKNLVRIKLGPPLRKLPVDRISNELSFTEDVSFGSESPVSMHKTTSLNEIMSSPAFTPIRPKRLRTTQGISMSSPISSGSSSASKTLFYSPKNMLNWMCNREHEYSSSSRSPSTSSSFLSDSFFSASPQPKLSPKRTLRDEYYDNEGDTSAEHIYTNGETPITLNDENEIDMAPVSKLLQAFLDKRHQQHQHTTTFPCSGSEKLPTSPSPSPNFKTLQTNPCSPPDKLENIFTHPVEQGKANNKQENAPIPHVEPVPPKQTLCFASIQQQLLNKKNEDPCHSNRQKINPRWNHVGVASIAQQKAHPEKTPDQMEELLSILAEHNAKVRNPCAAINIRNFSR